MSDSHKDMTCCMIHLYKVQEKTKLIYHVRSQVSGYLWGGVNTDRGLEWSSGSAGDILLSDLADSLQRCIHFVNIH